MDFLYPKFNKATHKIKASASISKEYPTAINFINKRDLAIQAGTAVNVVQENVGYACSWAKVIVVGQENTSESFYTLQNNLENIGGKQTYTPICNENNTPKLDEQEIRNQLNQRFITVFSQNELRSLRKRSQISLENFFICKFF